MTKTKDILQTPRAVIILGLLGLVLTYSIATRAIDTGSLGQYGLVFLVLFLTVRLFLRAIKMLRNDSKQ